MTATVPMFSLSRIQHDVDVQRAVSRVIEAGRYVLGPELGQFEERFAGYCGAGHCVGVASGTDALEIALRALGIGPGGRVVVAANAGYYGSTAVRALGAEPLFVDVDPLRLTLSASALDVVLAKGADAVIVTHLYGQLADMSAILAVTRRWHVPIVEDCAQAHGARSGGKMAGTFGDIGCYSFYPTKNLGAVGDAGAIVTDDDAIASLVRRLRQYGWDRKYRVESPGGRNSRLDEIQAAVLVDRLPYLDGWNELRKAIADRYVNALRGLPVTLPSSTSEDFVSHQFVIRTDDRDDLRDHLARQGIGTEVHYPVADHLQPAYADEEPPPPLPTTEAACQTVLSLPCYPGLTEPQQSAVIEAIGSFFSERGH